MKLRVRVFIITVILCIFSIFLVVFLAQYKVSIEKLPWAIGLFESNYDFKVTPLSSNPIRTKKSIRSVPLYFVADPFIYKENGTYYMFYEAAVVAKDDRRGVIALATSKDGTQWENDRIILEDKVSISFPIVFEYNQERYMTIEGRVAENIRLFKAKQFPYSWVCVDTLLNGAWSDPVIYYKNDTFYLFVSKALVYDAHLFYSKSLFGPYKEHPKNPIVADDRRIGRNAGNIFTLNNKQYRPVQDCSKMYEENVRLMEIISLTDSTYKEVEIPQSPVLIGSGKGWNKLKMHTFNIFNIEPNKFSVISDGAPYNSPHKIHISRKYKASAEN